MLLKEEAFSFNEDFELVEKRRGGNGEQKVQAEGNSNVMRFLLSGSFFCFVFSFEVSRRNRIISRLKYNIWKERSKMRNPETKRTQYFTVPCESQT